MTESKTDKVLLQLRTAYEAYSHNQNNVVKAAEALEAIEVIEELRRDSGRLNYAMINMSRSDFLNGFARYVIYSGGIGDLSDCRQYVDAEIKATAIALSQQVEANHE